ncbi:DUF6507 family protein [Micrococcus sp.]|uniref:DUF6507 family protein n=1 Tax=Micrococcus sp. TaxID=1271 RepID=UPI0026DB2343|nr:DUF6507 family protein [Micrococcus sp.]MDO4239236.1 DUF6507 family protein [Micrococcus sp.]
MRYSVNVPACAQVVNDVAVQCGGFEGAITGLSTSAEGAAVASQSGIVSEAVSGFFQECVSGNVESAVSLVSKAIEETNNALTYIHEGDEQMAATAVSSLETTEGSTGTVTSWGGRGGGPQAV